MTGDINAALLRLAVLYLVYEKWGTDVALVLAVVFLLFAQ